MFVSSGCHDQYRYHRCLFYCSMPISFFVQETVFVSLQLCYAIKLRLGLIYHLLGHYLRSHHHFDSEFDFEYSDMRWSQSLVFNKYHQKMMVQVVFVSHVGCVDPQRRCLRQDHPFIDYPGQDCIRPRVFMRYHTIVHRFYNF